MPIDTRLYINKHELVDKSTHALPVPVYQEPLSYRNEWPFRVYMIPVPVFFPV